MNRRITQKIDKQDIDYCKKWLCDKTPINVKEGLWFITTLNSLFGANHEGQLKNLVSKLLRYDSFAGVSVSVKHGTVTVDNVVTIETSDFDSDIKGHIIRSRPKFVKLIYQLISCFPVTLYKAYTEVTGENLILDDLSGIREFYENCSRFDSWTAFQFCAYISHCDPEAFDYLSENPNDTDYISFAPIHSRSDIYNENVPLLKAAILGGAFELIHFDRDNWLQSTLKPKKGLEWAKKKGVLYHPVLDELVFALNTAPVNSSGYTTPYLEMMQEVIREQDITRENQGKKESISASFAKKLYDHKLTPSSQKLADAMATLVRLPESQQGRAKTKG